MNKMMMMFSLLVMVSVIGALAYLVDHDPLHRSSADEQPLHLTERNLVDEIAAIPLQLSLRHVQVKPGILAIDLFAEQHITTETNVFEDIYAINKFAFKETVNVDRVLIRVMVKDAERNQLLLSMDAERTSWHELLRASSHQNHIEDGTYFRAFRGFKYTPAWYTYFKA